MEYTLSQIGNIVGGRLEGKFDGGSVVRAVVTDSRSYQVGENSMFVAIFGANHDGHEYLAQMYERGVRAFIVEKDVDLSLFPQAGFVFVESSVGALQRLAADYRSNFRGCVVAVTGSNGKTVVKEWFAQLAPDSVKVFRSPKSYNSQLGVALSLLMIAGDEAVVVIEAGISKPGEMERLEKMIRPNIGVITMVGDAHQENFATLDQKLEEKLCLFSGADTIIYNSTYPSIAHKVVALGRKSVDAAPKMEFAREVFADQASQENLAMVLTIFDVLGLSIESDLVRFRIQPVAMRLELKEGVNNSLLVNDSYNSDINSLSIALDYLASVAGGRRRVLVLSDILQSGLTDGELYGRVAQMVSAAGVDLFVGIGDRVRCYADLFDCNKEFYATTDAFLGVLNRDHTANSAILLKGNRVSQFERLSHVLQLRSHTTTLEVDLDAMIHNLNYFRSKLRPETQLMAMVKAFSYGNGDYEVAAMLKHQGVHYLAVAFADEGVRLREKGVRLPIVVLNADSDSFDLMITNGLEPEIYNFSSLKSFLSIARSFGERSYPIHIKLDTGMNRLGFREADIETLCEVLNMSSAELTVRSVFSHLASSDDKSQDEFTLLQIEIFERMSSQISASLGYKPLRHIANSAAIERFPQAQFDVCRLGIGLYGISADCQQNLKMISALKTRIVHIKDVASDETIGYGREGKTVGEARIATIPIGYADGLDRHLGKGQWSVLVRGARAPIVGRVCMDTCMIDVTGFDAEEGDVVTIFGAESGNTVMDMARVLDTIPYEIMTSVSARVKRIYLKE